MEKFLVGLLLLGAISFLLNKKSIKSYTLYLPNNIANFSIFYRKKLDALN